MTDTPDIAPPALTTRWLALGFAAGAVAVLVFHQGMLALLHATGFTARAPFPMNATAPFGIPQIWSLAFWGGVWGIVLAAVLAKSRSGADYWSRALIVGALGPTLVAWFVVAPLKGQPLAGGFQAATMLGGLLVNGAWGVGTALLLKLLIRTKAAEKNS